MTVMHGGDLETVARQGIPLIADFSANINPLGLPQGVQEAVVQALGACVHYPDPLCRTLREALAEAEGVPLASVICGNGAADLIFRVVYGLKPRKALVLAPTFAEYEQALQQVACDVCIYELDEANDFRLTADFLDALDETLDLIFLCNPNNPTGQLIAHGLLLQIIARCQACQITVVLDECFTDFVAEPLGETCVPVLAQFPNLFILKAMTKIYAMAGLRLGYGLCADPQLLAAVSAAGQPWSVSTLAQVAGVAALADQGYLLETAQVMATERPRLQQGLQQLGLTVYAPQANYIFFRSEVTTLQSALLARGFLIRSCSSYRGLDAHYYRIAVKSAADNQLFLQALTDALREIRPC